MFPVFFLSYFTFYFTFFVLFIFIFFNKKEHRLFNSYTLLNFIYSFSIRFNYYL